MATLYTTVNKSFLGKITDQWLNSLSDEALAAECEIYRNGAIPKFKKCTKDLTLQDETGFLPTLTSEEIEIIANLMVLEWIRPKLNNLEILKQALGSKDFQLYSQANHLKELRALREDVQSEISGLIVDYTYNNYSLDDL